MTLSNPPVLIAMLFGLLGLIFLLITIKSLKMKQVFSTVRNLMICLLMFSLSALFGTISIAVQGYHALTKEELAAVVKVEPTGEQMFHAWFTLPDGGKKEFILAGDQITIDAHILKWKPLANILGLHTSYILDRVSGRYENLTDETTRVRTVYSLSKNKPLDMFELRRRFAFLNPLLDAEYGSATFIKSDRAEEFKVLVSTTGLLIRTTGNAHLE